MKRAQLNKYVDNTHNFDMEDEELLLLPLSIEEAEKLDEYICFRFEEFSMGGARDKIAMEVMAILADALSIGEEHLSFRRMRNAEGE